MGEIDLDKWLKEELRKERIEISFGSQDFFVPRDALESLIIVSVVKQYILKRGPTEHSNAEECAEEICKYARQLFATLAIMGKASEIYSFVREGVSDRDLPLIRDPTEDQFLLRRKETKQRINAMENWSDQDLEKFELRQRWMTAPFFEHMEHHELDDNAILPFIPLDPKEEIPEIKQGGFSKVSPARLHSAHHNFWRQSGLEVRAITWYSETMTNWGL